ncbi:MAG: type II toxin-antitoxin system RelE/ParE family toxin [Cytophagia bacterium]|nr:MAG: type II toxin-antitoxin system RelE/ParE family toxin [Cytophagales bacterium]TAG02995.1 MAG: type II toxin-antitoxin system RelE/ParE family toxin [Cytophagia bacterium]TAG42231.1 MAG: type II toxin-antitoxin system RelE/ParE family toxin [Cytophagia bacterium]
MVTAKKVIWTETAKNDLKNIHNRIFSSKSPQHAKALMSMILAATAALETKHDLGIPEKMLARESDPYKFLTVAHYKIIYSIVGDDAVVEIIYHQRQDAVV